MLKVSVLRLRSLFENVRKTRRKKILILFLLILHILPIWIFGYFPSQDGPGHVYNSYVLKAFHTEESTLLRGYYTLNLPPF